MEGGQKGACTLKTGLDLAPNLGAPNLGAPTSEHLLHLHSLHVLHEEKILFQHLYPSVP